MAWTPPRFNLYADRPSGLSALQNAWTGFYTGHNVEEAARGEQFNFRQALANAELEQRRRDEEDRARQFAYADKERARERQINLARYAVERGDIARAMATEEGRYQTGQRTAAEARAEDARRFEINKEIAREANRVKTLGYDEPGAGDTLDQQLNVLDSRTANVQSQQIANAEQLMRQTQRRALTAEERTAAGRITPETASMIMRSAMPQIGRLPAPVRFDEGSGVWTVRPATPANKPDSFLDWWSKTLDKAKGTKTGSTAAPPPPTAAPLRAPASSSRATDYKYDPVTGQLIDQRPPIPSPGPFGGPHRTGLPRSLFATPETISGASESILTPNWEDEFESEWERDFERR